MKWLSRTVKQAFPETTVVVENTVAQSIPETLLQKTDADNGVIEQGNETFVELLQSLLPKPGWRPWDLQPHLECSKTYISNMAHCHTVLRIVEASVRPGCGRPKMRLAAATP